MVVQIGAIAQNGDGERIIAENKYGQMVKELFALFRQERPLEIPEFWKIVIRSQACLRGSNASGLQGR
jgi:hypothetical protein